MARRDTGLPPSALQDLTKSGLHPEDLEARPLGEAERAATGTPSVCEGYVIPYFDAHGVLQPFYRVKVSGNPPGIEVPKYKQPRGSPNYIYFPPGFSEVLRDGPKGKCLILTEGEKKAAKGVKEGFAVAAVAGVDSWRNRTLLLPRDTDIKALYAKSTHLRAKLPGGSTPEGINEDVTLAIGLVEFVQGALDRGLPIVIVYDTDGPEGLKFQVKRAAAVLGYHLRGLGVSTNHLRLLELPAGPEGSKMGLDDFLLSRGPGEFQQLLDKCLRDKHQVPRHPNPRQYVNHILNRGFMNREAFHQLGASVLAELDARGRRLIDSNTGSLFYFDEKTLQLLPVELLHRHGVPMHETPFGKFLYKEFGITASDSGLLTRLAAQMSGEEPIENVVPQRVLARTRGGIAVQVSSEQFIHVTAEDIELVSNGTWGVMFEAGHVSSMGPQQAFEVVEAARNEIKRSGDGPLEAKWVPVLEEVNFEGQGDASLAALLFYISPWFWRHKGMQLPIEVYTGEPGSGKSSLVSLRLEVLTGRPLLRNVPHDLRDWHASVANAGGLHIIDNVHFTDKTLRQRLSDEYCRITTEASPSIEMRQLYTTSTVARIPVFTAFGLTAIHSPFTNPDFQQRSVQFSLAKKDAFASPDSDWVPKQLARGGGRTGWLAHHLAFIHRFLQITEDPKLWAQYTQRPVSNRLIHFEAAMCIAAEILGLDSYKPQELREQLNSHGEGLIVESDKWLREIKRYLVSEAPPPGRVISADDLLEWFMTNGEETHLPSSHDQLERFVKGSRSLLARTLGLHTTGDSGSMAFIYRPSENQKS